MVFGVSTLKDYLRGGWHKCHKYHIPTKRGNSRVESSLNFETKYDTYDRYDNAGFFEVVMTPKNRTAVTTQFTGRILGSSSNILNQVAIETVDFKFNFCKKDLALLNVL